MRRLGLGALLLCVAAAAHANPADYKVLETFGVGDGVYVRALTVDPHGKRLWVGSSVGAQAVDLTTGNLLHTFTRTEGLANEYVFSTFVDSRGNTWFGTNGGGASRYREGKWKTFFPLHGLADYWVYGFDEQRDGTVWIGTWAGVTRVDGRSGQLTSYLRELVNEWVYGVAVDHQDRVWFGTEGGVSMFDGKTWRAWTHADGLGAPNTGNLLPSENSGLGTRSRHDVSVLRDGRPTYNPGYVFCVHVARDNSVWAGTWGGGVSHFDGHRWTNLTAKDGLPGNLVFSIAEDKEGVLWFGTDQGLARYDGKAMQRWARADGLPGDSVYAVAVTPAGEVWVGTRGGVARLGQGKNKDKAQRP